MNWLLWGYGVPAASFWIGSYFLRRNGDDAALRTVEAAAILFTVLLAFLQIRHAIYAGDVYHPRSSLAEIALQVSVALALAIGLERLRLRSGSMIHNVAALLVSVFAGLAGVFGLLLIENPMISTTDWLDTAPCRLFSEIAYNGWALVCPLGKCFTSAGMPRSS